jgi:Pyruvate/2-oxoacid:ferredoxin oxidoreductase gamma subunit
LSSYSNEIYAISSGTGAQPNLSSEKLKKLKARIPSLEEQNIETNTVDATQIALDHIGRNIVNTIMLGYLSARTGVVSLDSLLTTIKSTFKGPVAETNIKATEYIYEQYVQ